MHLTIPCRALPVGKRRSLFGITDLALGSRDKAAMPKPLKAAYRSYRWAFAGFLSLLGRVSGSLVWAFGLGDADKGST